MRLRAAILILFAASNLFGQAPGIKTDMGVYPEPTPPALPAPGSTFVDPTFGTSILRVTGPDDGNLCSTIYSYWPSMNKDNTHLHAACDGTQMLWDFDPVQLRVSNKRPLFATNPLGAKPRGDMAIWSGTNPDEIFSFEGPRLWKYNVATSAYVLLSDFSPVPNLWQMSRSMDDQIFAFTAKNDTGKVIGYLVWNRAKDSILIDQPIDTLDEVQIDKTGRFLVVKTNHQGQGRVEVIVRDLQTGTADSLYDNGPDYAPGHSDNGTGIVVGEDNWSNRVTARNLATPHTMSTAFSYGNDWAQSGHISMLADNEDWVQMSTASAPTVGAGVLRNEIFQASTDGTQKVRRLCHHHCVRLNYDDFPFANISRDGQFVAFSSNWGTANGRKDVFVLKIPPAPGGSISPSLELSGTGLTFSATAGGANPSSQAITITNKGSGTLNAVTSSISYGSGIGWLTVTQSGAGNSQTLTNAINIAGLVPATYTATVSVGCSNADNTPGSYTVSLTINTPTVLPRIALSDDTLNFNGTAKGTAPAAQTILVTNSGTGTLNSVTRQITYTGQPGWLAITRTGTGNSQTLSNAVNLSTLNAGTYSAEVAVSCANATNTPLSYRVVLTVTNAPGMVAEKQAAGLPVGAFRFLPGRSSIIVLQANLGEEASQKNFSVRDVQGRVVGRIEVTGTGLQTVQWNATGLKNGIYFIESRPCLLLK